MAKWLVKTEPSSWSFDQQIAAGVSGTAWTGVRNHTAKQFLMAMRKGDQVFFYHSNEGKAVVGIVQVTRTFYPDPTDASAAEEPRDARCDSGRTDAGRDGARQELAPVGAARHRQGVGNDRGPVRSMMGRGLGRRFVRYGTTARTGMGRRKP